MAGENRIPADRPIVTNFVEHLRDNCRLDLKGEQIRWLEDENPGHSEAEAIVGNLVIEHTSIDTLPSQRTDGKWFMDALASVESIAIPFRLDIAVPYELVTRGSDWPALNADLTAWITDVAPSLPNGGREFTLPATPLPLIAAKGLPGNPGVFLARPIPADDAALLASRVSDQIRRKVKKLKTYKPTCTTVLLLESTDNALMNSGKMLEAVRVGVGGHMPEGLDQLWYVESHGCVFFDFTAAITDGTDELG